VAKGSKKKRLDSSGNGGNAPQKMTRKEFEKELAKLQIELTRLQAWAVAEGARVIVVFEGRDTAGKGGVISRIMQRCSPRVFKHVALPTPSDREKSQLYIQRYLAHFPAAGEIVGFDRSWYNRAGVRSWASAAMTSTSTFSGSRPPSSARCKSGTPDLTRSSSRPCAIGWRSG
jgi:polyphosphate kinase 2 (PPK2 family)